MFFPRDTDSSHGADDIWDLADSPGEQIVEKTPVTKSNPWFSNATWNDMKRMILFYFHLCSTDSTDSTGVH